jgi:hypothetical protein
VGSVLEYFTRVFPQTTLTSSAPQTLDEEINSFEETQKAGSQQATNPNHYH